MRWRAGWRPGRQAVPTLVQSPLLSAQANLRGRGGIPIVSLPPPSTPPVALGMGDFYLILSWSNLKKNSLKILVKIHRSGRAEVLTCAQKTLTSTFTQASRESSDDPSNKVARVGAAGMAAPVTAAIIIIALTLEGGRERRNE